jgi:hypothetical protein
MNLHNYALGMAAFHSGFNDLWIVSDRRILHICGNVSGSNTAIIESSVRSKLARGNSSYLIQRRKHDFEKNYQSMNSPEVSERP